MRRPVLIPVCSKCKRASCFQGVFYCDEYRHATTIWMDVEKLLALALEHPDYWTDPEVTPR